MVVSPFSLFELKFVPLVELYLLFYLQLPSEFINCFILQVQLITEVEDLAYYN